MKDRYLENDRVALRALEPEDLGLLYTIENDRELWDVSCHRMLYSRFALRQYLASQPQDVFQCKELRLLVEDAKEQQPVGLVDLMNFSPIDGRAEVGIAILAEYRGRGYGSAAIAALERYAKEILHIRMLYSLVSENNAVCEKLFVSSAYQKVATLPAWHNAFGDYHDLFVFQKFI